MGRFNVRNNIDMKRINSFILAGFAAVVAVSGLLPAASAAAVSSASLSIVPKKNYTIEPGKSVKDKLVIRNLDTETPLELSLRVVDFTFTDDGGTPKLMLAEDAPQTTWSLKPFLTVPKTVSIEPRGTKSLDMSLAIPAGHGAGSYYSAIVYSSGASDGGNVGLSASGVTLVFTSIPGEVNEDLKLEKLGAYNLAKQGKKAGYVWFATQKPENIAYTLKNKGNVTEAPVGSIKLKGTFGNEITINNVNPNSSLALIGQTRTYTSCIKLKSENVDFNGEKSKANTCDSPGLWPGHYTVSANLFYGQNGNRTQEINEVATFWYMPYWAIAIIILLLAVIGYFIWRIVTKVQNAGSGRPKKRTRRK